MTQKTEMPDVVIVGGGIAGSALALVLARQGLAVTVLEQQIQYRDRLRGEVMSTWGVAEAQQLGIMDALRDADGLFARRSIAYDEVLPSKVAEATALDASQFISGVPGVWCAGHPATCQALGTAAEMAGARYARGVEHVFVTAGERPRVSYVLNGSAHELAPRMVVGADGRTSTVRAQVGIPLNQAEPRCLIAGLLVDDVAWPRDTYTLGTEDETMFFVFPQGGQRARLYTSIPPDQRGRYAGSGGVTRFLDDFRSLTCLPYGPALAEGTPLGLCPTYSGENTWTDRVFLDRVVLIGDAAGYSNPLVGQGLSMALRDVRQISEILLDGCDLSEQFAVYASERRERAQRVHFLADLQADLYMTFGPEGAARRRRVFERLQNAEDPAAMCFAPIMIGPDRTPDWVYTDDFRAEVLR
jgi:2-polyprenyl-6-methoxyphenol hydroxylase-like FAD-dependent oxidoreductase